MLDARSRRLPFAGAEYQHLLRTPNHRWWRPILSFVVVVVAAIGGFIALTVAGILALFATGGVAAVEQQLAAWGAEGGLDTSVGAMAFLDLTLALLIPVSLMAVWLGNWARAGSLHSVTGRVRWGWLLRCVAVLLPLWAVYIGAEFVLSATPDTRPEPNWVGLVLLALFLTPLQAAGEEYLFRGWIMQNVSAWFRNPRVALVVGGALSVGLFAWAHGSADPWILLDLGAAAAAAVYLTWRTGGLEAAIAVHTVNNVTVGIGSALSGATGSSLVTEQSTGDPLSALISVAVDILAVLIVLRLARRADLTVRATEPHALPAV